jgi:hypothetical protein
VTGSDTITANATDSFGNAATQQTVAVVANGTPVVAVPGARTLCVSKSATISGISLSETGNTAGESFTVTLNDANGVLSASTAGGATVSSSNGGTTLTVGGSLTQVDAALATLSDTDSVAGSDNITVNAADGFGNTATQQTVAVTANGTPVIAVPSRSLALVSFAFNGGNGSEPFFGSLIADAAGDLFGTTEAGGQYGYGTVFEIANTGGGYGAPTTLASFNGSNAEPFAGLIADAAGDLFGTTSGTVFEIVKTGSVYGAPTTLASFNGSNGSDSETGLITDAAGDLFGTTSEGGQYGDGTVFEIVKTGSVYGVLTTLASFNGSNGYYPHAVLTADAAGDLFGTTDGGGQYNDGTVFEIVKTGSVYGAPTTLVSFNGSNGVNPYAGLIADAAGDLFGTTIGGGLYGDGTVFEIVRTGSVYSAPTTLVSFNGSNGVVPYAGLITDAAGDLFGTTYAGANGYGTVFEIVKTGSVYGAPTTLVSFNNGNGSNPFAGLFADAAGDLFGTTSSGANGYGTVFELSQITKTLGIGKATTISGISLSENGNTAGEIFTVTLSDSTGALSASNSGGATVSSSNGGKSLTIVGSLAQANAALATLSDTESSFGTDTITLNTTDGFGNNASQQIVALAVNGLPAIKVPAAQLIGVGKAVGISGVSLSENGNTAGETFTVTLSDGTGVLSASNAGGANVASSNGGKTLTVSGNITQVNAALAALTDTEASSVSDTIQLNATDGFGNSATQQSIAVTSKANWSGDTLIEYYYYPSTSNLYYTSPTFVAPASAIKGDGTPTFYLSATANSVTASNFYANTSWNSATFNGFEIVDETHNLISGVTIDASTNMAGLTASRITFGSNYLEVNWQGLSFNTSTVVKLDLTFDPPVDASQMTLAQMLDGTTSPASNSGILTVADGSEIALAGTINNSGTIAINASTAPTAIEVQGSTTLQGGGQINLSENDQNYVFGSGSLTNVDNTISGSGDIGDGTLAFINQGVVQTQGSYALIIDTGTNPFVNTGSIETNSGTMIVKSQVTGGGNAIINGGTLEFGAASDNKVTFNGSDLSVLALDQSLGFNGSVAGFGDQDQIDLGDIGFGANTTLGYAANSSNTGGMLSVSDGTHLANIALLGQYAAASFVAASDGHGGTLITDPPPSQQQLLTQPNA